MPSPGFVTERHEHTAGIDRAAFSPDGTYRYALFRRWGRGPTLCWIGLNPGTANAFRDDDTSELMIQLTRQAGSYGGIVIVNLYALAGADADELWAHPDPIGPLGDQFLTEQAGGRTSIIAAWGTHGGRNERGQHVADMLAQAGVTLLCLGVTGNGQPKHPLYISGDTQLEPYRVGVGCHA